MRQGRCPRCSTLRTDDKAIKVSQPALCDPHLQQFKAAGNSGQKIIEVVRQPAGQLPDRLHLLCLEQLLLGLLQLQLSLATLGEIASDLREADELTRLIVNGINNDAGPEAGAILPDAPAFSFEAPFAARRLKGC